MDRYAIIIAGPSGVGKTTVADRLIEELGTLEMSRSATTRPIRYDGRENEYIYLGREEFLSAIEAGDMAEHAEYGGCLYGTRKSELERILSLGKQPILVLEYNGVLSLKQSLDYPVFAFYVYESLDAIRHRLVLRDGADSEKVEKRCSQNACDYRILPTITERFDAFVENNDLDICIATLTEMIAQLREGREVMSGEEKLAVANALYSEATLK